MPVVIQDFELQPEPAAPRSPAPAPAAPNAASPTPEADEVRARRRRERALRLYAH